MISDVDKRASLVMDFINNKTRELNRSKELQELQSSPELKMRRLNNEYQKAPSACMNAMLGKMYKNALPFDDPHRYGSDDQAQNAIHDFIGNRCGGKDTEWYVREALKKNKSVTLQKMLTESQNIARKFYSETSKNLGKINLKDINFNPNAYNDELEEVTKKLEFDEISELIHNNVQTAMQSEIDKAKAEEEYQKKLEDDLAEDPDVVDDDTMQNAMQQMESTKPTIYEPSLMEAIMIGNAKVYNDRDSVINESVREYTKLSMMKALKLEKFDLINTKKLVHSYMG